MGKIQLVEFEIIVDHNRDIFFNNNTISGFCLIVLNGILDLKSLKIKLNGEAVAKWTEEAVQRGNSKTHQQKLTLISLEYDFLTNAKETIITRGVHRIPFTFQLPNYSPNSFEGTFGHIRYWIESEIVKSIVSINHKTKKAINLLSSLRPYGSIPMTYNKTKKYTYCCIKTGSISYSISIPKSYFNRGDFIHVSYEIKNKTNSSLRTEATLIERHVYKANRLSRIENNKHITIKGPVIVRSSESEDVLEVPIPANTRLSIKCQVIDVEYYLRFYINDNNSGVMHDFPVIIIDPNI